MREYIYFISYSHSHGTGNVEVKMKARIDSMKDIREIEAHIPFEGKKVITFFELLKIVNKKKIKNG